MRNRTTVRRGKIACGVPAGDVLGRHKTSVHFRLQQGLQVELGCLLCWFAATSVTAQESDVPALVASLVLSTVPPLPILSRLHEQLDSQARHHVEYADGGITALRDQSPDAEAWAKFETEYRPERQNPASFRSQIETAKYGLDTTLFSVDRFVKSIREHADFGFDQSHRPSTRANSRSGFLDNPRVKLDLDLTHAKPYIGARVVIAFGN
jgi:hypothetical protein